MPHQPNKRPRSVTINNGLSARSLVILFLATLSVSFMLLLILFQAVFKNIHLQLDTHSPEAAPVYSSSNTSSSGFFSGNSPLFERMGVQTAVIQTPGHSAQSGVSSTEMAEPDLPQDPMTTDSRAIQEVMPQELATLPLKQAKKPVGDKKHQPLLPSLGAEVDSVPKTTARSANSKAVSSTSLRPLPTSAEESFEME
ncbi:MAG: hypothetical protein U0003_04120 [Vampirovibrionales bacterium]